MTKTPLREARVLNAEFTTLNLFECCKLPDRPQSFVFCSQIVTEWINAMSLLVSKFKMIGMLLNVVHGQVQKS